ncbi:MAG: hypothetical protein J6V90_08185 [Treponema sp.]|nr:hypothetical protein [Treponema sp.]
MDFTSWENDEERFTAYFWRHYAPILNKLADCPYDKVELTAKDKMLIPKMRDDLLTIFREAKCK